MRGRQALVSLALSAVAVFGLLNVGLGDPPKTVDLPTDWKVGDGIDLEYVKERVTIRGLQKTSAKSSTPIELRVVEKLEAGYVFDWKIGTTKFFGKQLPGVDPEKLLADINKGFTMRVETDEFGTPVRIVNIENAVEMFKKGMEAAFELLRKNGSSDVEITQARAAAAPFLRRETIEMMAIQDVAIFLMPSGGSYSVSKPQEFEDELPNPFGGKPFPTKCVFRVKSVDDKARTTTVEWKQELEPKATRRLLLDAITKMAKAAGRPPPKDDELPSFEVKDEATYVYDLKTGWPVSVVHQRATRSGPASRTDRKEYRVKPKRKTPKSGAPKTVKPKGSAAEKNAKSN